MSDWGVPCTPEVAGTLHKPANLIQDQPQPTFGQRVLVSNYEKNKENLLTEQTPNEYDIVDIVEEELKRMENDHGSQMQLMHTGQLGHKCDLDTPLETDLRLT